MRMPRSLWSPTRRSTTPSRGWRAREYRRYMCGRHAASGGVKAAETGIVTERDVLRAIARFGAAALDLPVGQIMSQPLAAVPADAFVYRAIGRMNRLKTRHLGVVDESGCVVGALSARDLLRCGPRRRYRSATRSTMRRTRTPWRLPGRSCRGSRQSLLAEGLSGRDIAEVISRELGALTRQAAVIAERHMREARPGRTAMRLCDDRARIGRPRRKPAGDGPGQCADFRTRRAGRRGGSLVRGARGACRGYPA